MWPTYLSDLGRRIPNRSQTNQDDVKRQKKRQNTTAHAYQTVKPCQQVASSKQQAASGEQQVVKSGKVSYLCITVSNAIHDASPLLNTRADGTVNDRTAVRENLSARSELFTRGSSCYPRDSANASAQCERRVLCKILLSSANQSANQGLFGMTS